MDKPIRLKQKAYAYGERMNFRFTFTVNYYFDSDPQEEIRNLIYWTRYYCFKYHQESRQNLNERYGSLIYERISSVTLENGLEVRI